MSKFSRRTLVEAIDVLDLQLSQAETSHFLLTLGPEVKNGVRGEGVSVRKRMNDLIEFVDEHPDHVIDDGLLITVIIEKAVALLPLDDPENEWTETSGFLRGSRSSSARFSRMGSWLRAVPSGRRFL